MRAVYVKADKQTKARERAETILRELRRHRGHPVGLADLVERSGPYHLEVHQVLATLEALGMVQRFEEVDSDSGAHRVAYAYVRPTDRAKKHLRLAA